MKWEKLGLVCKPNGSWWDRTHCYTPVPHFLHDRLRVYYSSWDDEYRGRIGYADFAINDPTKLIYQTKEPILDIGEPGTFDCDGVCPEYIIDYDGKKWLYYIGFQRTSHKKVDFIFCGLAVGDGHTFKKYSTIPILDRTKDEAFIRSSVSVLNIREWYYIWYTASRSGWQPRPNAEKYHSWSHYPTYDISMITTKTPYELKKQPIKCEGLRLVDEIAVGRPWVVYEDKKLKMWYSVKTVDTPYKTAYAESYGGIYWDRFPDSYVGLYTSNDGWDSEMVCFPAIIDIEGERYMFYNGNKHGKDGIGLARLLR